MVVNLSLYGKYLCNFKLIIQIFIYKILIKKKKKCFELNFDMVWSMIRVGKERYPLMCHTP